MIQGSAEADVTGESLFTHHTEAHAKLQIQDDPAMKDEREQGPTHECAHEDVCEQLGKHKLRIAQVPSAIPHCQHSHL